MSMHCENCGQDNPSTNEGYTACCNECLCDGNYSYRFGTETDNVTACCWAKAELKFEAEGREVPDGSYRLHN